MIQITSGTSPKIVYKGTIIKVSPVVARLEVYCPADGKTLRVALTIYKDVASYDDNNPLSIEGVQISQKIYPLGLGTDPETYAPQSVDVAHDKVIEYLEDEGFTAVKI